MARSRVVVVGTSLLVVLALAFAVVARADDVAGDGDGGGDVDTAFSLSASGGGQWKRWRVAMYAPGDAPASGAPGDGMSFVALHLGARERATPTTAPAGSASASAAAGTGSAPSVTSAAAAVTKVGAVIFHSDVAKRVGVLVDDAWHVCCTDELRKAGVRCEPGELVTTMTADDQSLFWVGYVRRRDDSDAAAAADDDNDAEVYELDVRYAVQRSGVHYMYVVNCGADDAHFDTSYVEWMNPYGHLPANFYFYKPFSFGMLLAYAVVALLWAVLCVVHWRRLMALQLGILVVMIVGAAEQLLTFLEFRATNATGQRNMTLVFVNIFMSALKNTLSLSLILAVCMGWCVVRPSLGTTQYKIAALALAYLVFIVLSHVVEHEQSADRSWSVTSLLVIMPVALLSMAFFWWIFVELIRLINQLKLRQQGPKLRMYNSLFWIMVGAVLLTVVVVGLQIAFSFNSDRMWRTEWLNTAAWDLLYYLIMLALAVIFRPTNQNQRYSYLSGDEEMTEIGADGRTHSTSSSGDASDADADDPLPDIPFPSVDLVPEDDDNEIDEQAKME